MRLLFANVPGPSGILFNRVGLRFPGTIDSPDAAEAAGSWRRKSRRNARPAVPPAPARFPELALSCITRHRDADLAFDRCLHAKSRPLHEAARPARPFDEIHIHRGKSIVAGSIADGSGKAIRKFLDPAIRERELTSGQQRVWRQRRDSRHERVSRSSEPGDLNRIDGWLVDVIPRPQCAIRIVEDEPARAQYIPGVGIPGVAIESTLGERGRLAPTLLTETNARELAKRRVLVGTLAADGFQHFVGNAGSLAADRVERVIEQTIANGQFAIWCARGALGILQSRAYGFSRM